MSTKLSLRFVKEKFNVIKHLNSLDILRANHARYQTLEKEYLEKVVRELKGTFATKRGESIIPVSDSRRAEIISFTDGSQAKNPLFKETLTHRIAKEMGHA
jgi:hypothetical protein